MTRALAGALLAVGGLVLAAPQIGHADAAASARRSAANAPVYREFGAWALGCDNTGACVAKWIPAAPDDPQSPEVGLRIARGGGRGGTTVVSLTGPPGLDPAGLRIDGRAAPQVGGWRRRPHDTGWELEGAPARAFIQALRGRRALKLSAKADAPQIPLAGLVAAMSAADAISQRGASAAPPVPIAPRSAAAFEPADTSQLAARVRRRQAGLLRARGCATDLQDGERAYALGRGEAIVLLPCRAGPYQTAFLAFRARGAGRIDLLRLAAPTLRINAEAGEYADPDFDPASATLSEAVRGRALGDCGYSADWTFDGRAFRLTRFARQDRCGGPPGDWLVLFRSQAPAPPP